jgi:hypothetical protein
MDGILRKRVVIDELTGLARKETEDIKNLYGVRTKRKDIVEFLKDVAIEINKLDD